jgi:hypothetical protein
MMTTKITKWVVAIALAGIAGSASPSWLVAQSAAPQEATAKPPAPPQQQLKVTIVVSHYQGEKRTSNLPYMFYTSTGEQTYLRTGSQIPIPQTIVKAGESPIQSFSYQNVGINIDCRVMPASPSGPYRLNLSIQDSWVSDAATNRPAPAGQSAAPVIQSWQFGNNLALRDGQTLQYTTATDKVTGEVVKIDVTLEVIK